WCRSAVCLGRGVLTYTNRSLFLQCSPLCGSFNRQSNNSWINKIVKRLSPRDKLILYQELSKNINDKFDPSNYPPETQETPLTYAQLKLVIISSCLPFIGFGFLDNAIMIVAGEYIDMKFSTLLGISTMAAAGLGNLVSDLFGIGLVGYVEKFIEKIGISVPPLTASQLACSSVRWSVATGRIIGITIGCLLGLLPLICFNR
ncbi:Transmembrane protein, partial [Schistosoma japonicum]